MIDIKNLTEKYIGKWVVYKPELENESGKIKSWNEHFIFVVYKCGGNWDRFTDYTGESTRPEDLFIK